MKLAKACNALHPEQPRRILLVGWVVKTEIPGHFCFAVSCPPYELGSGGAGATSPVLYLVYVRGKAYQASNQGKEAAAEYQKILDHRGVVGNRPIGALAHLELSPCGKTSTLTSLSCSPPNANTPS